MGASKGKSLKVIEMEAAEFVMRYVNFFQNIGAGNSGGDFPEIDRPLSRFHFSQINAFVTAVQSLFESGLKSAVRKGIDG